MNDLDLELLLTSNPDPVPFRGNYLIFLSYSRVALVNTIFYIKRGDTPYLEKTCRETGSFEGRGICPMRHTVQTNMVRSQTAISVMRTSTNVIIPAWELISSNPLK